MSLDETIRYSGGSISDDDVKALFDKMIAEYNEKDDCGMWALIPEQVNLLAKASSVLNKVLEGENVDIVTTVFDDVSKMGSIVITGKDVLTFTDPSIVADIARAGAGIDVSALRDGNIEVVFGFRTAEQIARG